jgi:hypothetical protein
MALKKRLQPELCPEIPRGDFRARAVYSDMRGAIYRGPNGITFMEHKASAKTLFDEIRESLDIMVYRPEDVTALKIENKPADEAKQRPNQEHRLACRVVAKALWEQDPTITIHDMGYRDEINALLRGKGYSDATFRDWFKDLCPNRQPGRRKKK